ncbi:3-oxoacid CoA-transferase subunit B [Metabacillus fastidiosus]|uniref:3-oxoacid CoA-transferase subunit B n=1 Tax=Metabacillus fastidiosus TaxID=1458 RepID=UPI0008244E27|nr:3-oxoacid CoA-transferase subunit B [Metabacillus fastidiosus]MED4455183.1 3-oxoacid CoA-transferase subunit B [Metabacillus fastidiosus]MED4462769.1 3-oxoacid CoA-transferase subunit B [Metabacillus fastidiosus]
MGLGIEIRSRIARRAAQEISDGMIVNLGIGIPSLVANFLENKKNVMIQAENGILGIGKSPAKGLEDKNLCNAGGYPVTVCEGSSYFDSSIAFGMIRKGYIDMTILGALQVSEKGDLANWIVPGKIVPGMGGAMELAQKAKKVVVLMNHVTKKGEPKIMETCTLPLTSKACVQLIITDRAVIEVTNEGLVLTGIMSPFTVEEVIHSTAAPLKIRKEIEVIF